MGNDVKEMIVECCNEFIQCVSSEANEISTKENKTTILPEHVVAALESLDFASMIETVKATMNELKEEDKEVRAEKGMQISDEEALRLQQEMFAAAKARYNSGDATIGAGQPPAAANTGSLD